MDKMESVLFLFNGGDHIHAASVLATLKFSVNEIVYQITSQTHADYALA
jgi:hypothetical protein